MVSAGGVTKKKIFKCQELGCPKSFDTRYGLRVHQRCHTGETPYQCQVQGCNQWFKWRSSLQHHRKMHAREVVNSESSVSDLMRIWMPMKAIWPTSVRSRSSGPASFLDVQDTKQPLREIASTIPIQQWNPSSSRPALTPGSATVFRKNIGRGKCTHPAAKPYYSCGTENTLTVQLEDPSTYIETGQTHTPSSDSFYDARSLHAMSTVRPYESASGLAQCTSPFKQAVWPNPDASHTPGSSFVQVNDPSTVVQAKYQGHPRQPASSVPVGLTGNRLQIPLSNRPDVKSSELHPVVEQAGLMQSSMHDKSENIMPNEAYDADNRSRDYSLSHCNSSESTSSSTTTLCSIEPPFDSQESSSAVGFKSESMLERDVPSQTPYIQAESSCAVDTRVDMATIFCASEEWDMSETETDSGMAELAGLEKLSISSHESQLTVADRGVEIEALRHQVWAASDPAGTPLLLGECLNVAAPRNPLDGTLDELDGLLM